MSEKDFEKITDRKKKIKAAYEKVVKVNGKALEKLSDSEKLSNDNKKF